MAAGRRSARSPGFRWLRVAKRTIAQTKTGPMRPNTTHANTASCAGTRSIRVIAKTCHTGGVARYDARVDIHHHLICLRCNSVVDLDDENLSSLTIPDTSAFGFEVSDFRVQLRGVCRNCGKKSSKQRIR